MNIVILGKGSLAIKVLDWLSKSPIYDIIYVVPVVPEPAWDRSLIEYATNNKIKIVESGHYKDLPEDAEIDLAISIFYDKIIKQSFISRCKKIINIHSAPLPRYRGMSPINWALKNGESEHGVTIHEITPGIDDGPIISQLKYSIYPEFEEVIDVYKRSLIFAYELFVATMPNIEKIIPKPQDDNNALYYSSKDNVNLGERRFFTRKGNVGNVYEH